MTIPSPPGEKQNWKRKQKETCPLGHSSCVNLAFVLGQWQKCGHSEKLDPCSSHSVCSISGRETMRVMGEREEGGCLDRVPRKCQNQLEYEASNLTLSWQPSVCKWPCCPHALAAGLLSQSEVLW